MEESQHEQRPWWKNDGYWGALIGCCGWWIGWVSCCLWYQAYEPLKTAALPSLLISAGIGFQLILILELIHRLYPKRHGLKQLAMWGFLIFYMGTGLLALHV